MLGFDPVLMISQVAQTSVKCVEQGGRERQKEGGGGGDVKVNSASS